MFFCFVAKHFSQFYKLKQERSLVFFSIFLFLFCFFAFVVSFAIINIVVSYCLQCKQNQLMFLFIGIHSCVNYLKLSLGCSYLNIKNIFNLQLNLFFLFLKFVKNMQYYYVSILFCFCVLCNSFFYFFYGSIQFCFIFLVKFCLEKQKYVLIYVCVYKLLRRKAF